MVAFGGSTIILKRFEETGEPDELGNYAVDEVVYTATNCRHRPLNYEETVRYELDIATEWWRSTLPIHEYSSSLLAAIKAMPPDAVIEVDGQEYQIQGGVRPHDDFGGRPFKATIISKKQIG
jgi:hypothetical protein